MLISKSHECIKCGPGHLNACFVIYDNGWHCFSCGASSVSDKNIYSFKSQKISNKNIYIPNTIVFDPNQFSLSMLHWLYSFGIYKDTIKKYSIAYIPYDEFITNSNLEFKGESLIFPIIIDNAIVYYQRRFFPKKKILTVGDNSTLFITKESETITGGLQKFPDTVILTEDYISAIKTGTIARSICLFGTHLKNYVLKETLLYKNIFIWLDGDAPGQEGALKIYNKLCATIKYRCKINAFNHECYNIRIVTTEKDPKAYSSIEILNILKKDRTNVI